MRCRPYARFLVLALVLLVTHLRTAQGQASPPAPRPFVPWREGRLLRWKDFEAPVCPQELATAATRAGACSATVLELLPEVNEAGTNTFWVASYLVKANSWVRDSTSFDHALMLEHEQLHFDLNELIARKMRQRIRAYEQADCDVYGPELHAELTDLFRERTALNTQFDSEAYQDATALTLRRWQRWLRQELAALAAYRAPIVSVTAAVKP